MVADLNARIIIDAILSAIKHQTDFGFSLKSGCQTILAGYSQRGQTSLATFRAIQDKIPTELVSLINLKKCYSKAGPHNLEATMKIYLDEWKDKAISPLIYLILKGMLSADYDFLSAYTMHDFIKDEFFNSSLKTHLDQKNVKLNGIINSQELALKFSYYSDIENLLKPDALDPTFLLFKALEKALRINNISSGWTVKMIS